MSTSITFCGFLEKKSARFKKWNLRWFVLHNRRLLYFKDETLAKCQGEVAIENTTDVAVQQPEGGRKYIFSVLDTESDIVWWLSAPTMPLIESWMIGLLQTINGHMRKSENFETGKDSAQSPLLQPLPENAIISLTDKINEDMSTASQDGELMGLFMKRALSSNTWKERCVVLRDRQLTLFALEEDACDGIHPRGTRILDRFTKVAALPCGFENQSHSFAVVAANPPHAVCAPLRLSCRDEKTMARWMARIRLIVIGIMREETMIPPLGVKLRTGGGLPEHFAVTSFAVPNTTVPSVPPTIPPDRPPHEDSLKGHKSPCAPMCSSDDQCIYIAHFVTALGDGSGRALVEIFENERFLPLLGWSSLHLLPSDPHPLSDANGVRFVAHSLRTAEPPPHFRWCRPGSTRTEDNADVTTQHAAHLSLGSFSRDSEYAHLGDATFDSDDFTDCRTPRRPYFSYVESPPLSPQARSGAGLGMCTFECDEYYTHTGVGGWTYASSFAKFRDHLSENSSHAVRKGRDVVRRRKWVRMAEPVDTAGISLRR